MSAADLAHAAFAFLVELSPLLLVIAAISVADIIIWFVIRLMRQLPDYGQHRRSSKR